jgi:hypothetical protein
MRCVFGHILLSEAPNRHYNGAHTERTLAQFTVEQHLAGAKSALPFVCISVNLQCRRSSTEHAESKHGLRTPLFEVGGMLVLRVGCIEPSRRLATRPCSCTASGCPDISGEG